MSLEAIEGHLGCNKTLSTSFSHSLAQYYRQLLIEAHSKNLAIVAIGVLGDFNT